MRTKKEINLIKELFLKHFDKPVTELKFKNLYEQQLCITLLAKCIYKIVKSDLLKFLVNLSVFNKLGIFITKSNIVFLKNNTYYFHNYDNRFLLFYSLKTVIYGFLVNKNSTFMLKFNSIKLKILVLSFILLYFLKSAHLKFNYIFLISF